MNLPPTSVRARIATALLALLAAGAPASVRAEPTPELWFPVGEGLTYQVNWGVIPVGNSVVTNQWVEENGRRLVRISIRTRTNRVLEKLYPVDDLVESLIDPVTFLPVRFVKILSEGRYRCNQVTTFDHAGLVAHWTNNIDGGAKEFQLEPDTRDIISLTYYLRRRVFQPGEKEHYKVMADEKIYDLYVNAEERETVRLPHYGTVKTLRLEPQAEFGGVFVRKGRMWLWVTETERRLGAKLAAQVPIASVNILLTDVRGPGVDAWTQPAEAAPRARKGMRR